jgi:hypothetical protein
VAAALEHEAANGESLCPSAEAAVHRVRVMFLTGASRYGQVPNGDT